MRRVQSTKLADVIADVDTERSCELTRHDLDNNIAVSFLYDGDESSPDSCQWRIIAPDSIQLRQVVMELVDLLRARGIRCKVPHFIGKVSSFRDEGPWKKTEEQNEP